MIRTARRLGVRTVAVYSDADRHALHVRRRTRRCISGASPARESYLVGERIIAAAKESGAEAIHPGYGFLSENADFARSGDRRGADLGRAEAGQHPRDGPEGRGQEADGRGRRAGDARAISARTSRPSVLQGGGRRDRLSGADQGGRGRRRQGHAAGRRARRISTTRWTAASARRRSSFGDDRVILEKYILSAAPHRGAGVRRQPRQCRPSVRARLLAPAPPPESDRGSAGAGHGRGDARGGVRGGGAGGAGGQLRGRGDGRVHRRRQPTASSPTASGSWR